MGRFAIRTHRRVEMELRASLTYRLRLQPVHKSTGVAASSRAGNRRHLVDDEMASADQGVGDAESRDRGRRQRLPVEGTDESVSLRSELLVDHLDQRRRLEVRPQGEQGRHGETGRACRDLAHVEHRFRLGADRRLGWAPSHLLGFGGAAWRHGPLVGYIDARSRDRSSCGCEAASLISSWAMTIDALRTTRVLRLYISRPS